LEDASGQEVISRLISEHERQKNALEDEQKRAASANRRLLDLAGDMILNLEARIAERDQEILTLREENERLRQESEASHARNRLRWAQPGPPLSEGKAGDLDEATFSDVIQKVAVLNEEIFQAGALLTETLVIEPAEGTFEARTMRRQAVIAETRDIVHKYLGTHITDLLATESMKPQEGGPANQLLAQIALIVALTRWCAQTCRGWIPEDRDTSEFIEALYDDIRRAGMSSLP
jgi:hypothetical protein